jgi:hypothetical protein|nr:hypothetical protein [Caballeronia sp. dw_276]
MKPLVKALNRAVRLGLAVLIAATSAHASAYALDSSLDCKADAHAFIAPLQQDHVIEATPMRVEDNSINAFKPTRGSHLTAFDFGVFAVVGFQKDDAIFKTGTGAPIAESAYGAVVIGGEESVKQKVRAAGSDAIIHHVAPFITAIFCNRD